jgi:murein DD-endopeptidase MepM/ murein hydrolase activator NlpD
MHEGIDLGASTGTPIYAADGGKVIRATWYSGYGLCVDIDHENGRVTRYGHCSRLLVSAGDRVYQGQNIALVGNTGNSFGSHLHFEVRLDGTAYNPRKFLDF